MAAAPQVVQGKAVTYIWYLGYLHAFWFDLRPDIDVNQMNHDFGTGSGQVENMANYAKPVQFDTDEPIVAYEDPNGGLHVRALDQIGRVIRFDFVGGKWYASAGSPKFAPAN